MTPEQAKALLPIIQAFAEGETIERLGIAGEWETPVDNNFFFNADVSAYRVKRTPLTFRLWVHDSDGLYLQDRAHEKEYMKRGGWRLVEAVEVLK